MKNIILAIATFVFSFFFPNSPQKIEYSTITTLKIVPTSTPTATQILAISPRPTRLQPSPLPTDSTPWGVAQQIGEHTWTMKVNQDPLMATPQEILLALNDYRRRYGSQPLTADSRLTEYAQSRVDYFAKTKSIDSHAGFNNFLEKEDGFNKLGYSYLGENISYGYRLNGVHLIEWVYAGDEPHDKNQLDSKWDHVGIAVNGTATCFIFATGKM
ncbi:CAP domain-containing protein [Patescibacteria group bacterium]|nr:CAP domain-containing protein [Patescibacteria group bacterium]